MRIKSCLLSLAAVAALATGTAHAATNLIADGDFENSTIGQLGWNATSTGWHTTGYNFVFAGGTADTTGAVGSYGTLKLWGSNNGGLNALPASPAGGNFLAADGAFETEAVWQNVGGLTAGQKYAVTFYWAGAQQQGYDGPNTEQWEVSFGSETQSTAVVSNVSHGFTGWQKEVFTFTASSASQVLSFLAVGTPAGVPPFSVLDGVSVTAVPEPATWGMLGAGLGMLGLVARRRKARR